MPMLPARRCRDCDISAWIPRLAVVMKDHVGAARIEVTRRVVTLRVEREAKGEGDRGGWDIQRQTGPVAAMALTAAVAVAAPPFQSAGGPGGW